MTPHMNKLDLQAQVQVADQPGGSGSYRLPKSRWFVAHLGAAAMAAFLIGMGILPIAFVEVISADSTAVSVWPLIVVLGEISFVILGLAVGVAEVVVLKPSALGGAPWVFATTLGIVGALSAAVGGPFLLYSINMDASVDRIADGLVCGVAGGAILGVAQSLVLYRYPRAFAWVISNVLCIGLLGLSMALFVRGLVSESGVGVALLLHLIVSGEVLAWILDAPP